MAKEISNVEAINSLIKLYDSSGSIHYASHISNVTVNGSKISFFADHGRFLLDFNDENLDKQGALTPEELVLKWSDSNFFFRSEKLRKVTVTTVSGVATYHMTDDETPSGIPFYNEIKEIRHKAKRNTSVPGSIPLDSFKRRHNNGITDEDGKSVDINVVDGSNILLGGNGLEFAPDGTEVEIVIKYV